MVKDVSDKIKKKNGPLDVNLLVSWVAFERF